MTGAEYRSFLLYWGPMVLRDILEEDMYFHSFWLSSAITLLPDLFFCFVFSISVPACFSQ